VRENINEVIDITINCEIKTPLAVYARLPDSLILVIFFVLGVSQTFAPSRKSFPQATVRFGDTSFVLDIADTPAAQAAGLSGRPDIPERGGMVFVFDDAEEHTFWMKGMLTPIDIIWVRGDEILGFVEHAGPPVPGARDEDLERFPSPGAVDRVIELRAGSVKSLGLEPGQKVKISVP